MWFSSENTEMHRVSDSGKPTKKENENPIGPTCHPASVGNRTDLDKRKSVAERASPKERRRARLCGQIITAKRINGPVPLPHDSIPP